MNGKDEELASTNPAPARRSALSSRDAAGTVGHGSRHDGAVLPSCTDGLARPSARTLAAGEWWRLVTPLFVHSEGWPHLLFNLLWIGFAGLVAERVFGRGRG